MARITSEMAFPLHWPDGQPMTPSYRRKKAKFSTTFAAARNHLLNELRLLGARYVVISTNLPTRRDGLPYANQAQPAVPGVAVYFDFNGEQMVFACDRWTKIEHNIRAVGKTIEAIRGIARWGSTDMMKRAVSAFKALPSQPPAEDWRKVLGFPPGFADHPHSYGTALTMAKNKYRELALIYHADRGGNEDEMKRLNAAMEAAERELT